MLENYTKLKNGLIKQKSYFSKKKDYNQGYVEERYNSYGEFSVRMSFLRLGFLLGAVNEELIKILDVGYGNGDFINCAKEFIPSCYGNEINGYHIPDGCEFVSDVFCEKFEIAKKRTSPYHPQSNSVLERFFHRQTANSRNTAGISLFCGKLTSQA